MNSYKKQIYVIMAFCLVMIAVVFLVAAFTPLERQQTYLVEEQVQSSTSATLTSAQDKQLVNINTASAAQLQALPGIGEEKAQAIVDYREKYGSFATKEQLLNVEGIGEKTLENLEALICV